MSVILMSSLAHGRERSLAFLAAALRSAGFADKVCKQLIDAPMQLGSLNGCNDPHDDVHGWQLRPYPAKPITDDTLDAISRVSPGHRPSPDHQSEPGGGHSIENRVQA
jgi:hypothetical protein